MGRVLTEWTEDRLSLLSELYPRTDNVELASRLGVTVAAVSGMAFRKGFRKAPEYSRELQAIKSARRWEGYEPVMEDSRKCRTCGEVKPLSEYTRDMRWHKRDCKPCLARINREGRTRTKIKAGMSGMGLAADVAYMSWEHPVELWCFRGVLNMEGKGEFVGRYICADYRHVLEDIEYLRVSA